MANVNYEIKNDVLYLRPQDRIDSANAGAVEAELEAIRKENPADSVVIDLDQLQYISSAGLRVFLRMFKSNPKMEIVNASSEVYEVFEMTGFTEMFSIKKAFRRISVDDCEVIGSGANGIVYRLNPEIIVKQYRNPDALPEISRERELARRAFVLGVPTAIAFDIVRIGESYGSVFELLNADSLANMLQKNPDSLDECVQLSTDLLKVIHSTEVKPDDMPDMKAVVLDWAKFLVDYLPKDAADRLIALIDAVPQDFHMIHGDYHIKNVMVQNGEALLIDMDTLCYGNPVFEFGSIFNAYVGFHELDPNVSMEFLGIPDELTRKFWKKQLSMYFDTEDEAKLAKIEKKAMLVGYTRLMRRSIRRKALESEEGRRAVEVYKNHILELVNELDTLVF